MIYFDLQFQSFQFIIFVSTDSGPTVRQNVKAAGAVVSGSRLGNGCASHGPAKGYSEEGTGD